MNRDKITRTAAAMLLASSLAACSASGAEPPKTEYISYNDFLDHVRQGHVHDVELQQSPANGAETIVWDPYHLDDPKPEEGAQTPAGQSETAPAPEQAAPIEGVNQSVYIVGVPAGENVYQRLEPYSVDVMVARGENAPAPETTSHGAPPWITYAILGALAVMLTAPLWWSRAKAAWQYRKTKTGEIKTTFNDVAGVDEAVEELEDIVDYLKNPKKFRDSGLKVPKGLLLTGPPGNGKTLLAKAIAGETGVNFISISGADFVGSKWKGEGIAMVKAAFRQARSKSPCILFIDEIDAVGRRRSNEDTAGGGREDNENTLNQLLVELDGFGTDKYDVVLIAATNRADLLDPALTRPGRIDRHAHIGMPDLKSRERIINVYLKKHQCEEDITAAQLAKATYGFSGAQLAGMVNEAGLLALRSGRKVISRADIEEAKDKMLLGKQFKTRQFSEEERNTTAYHEAGHALLAHLLPDSFPVYKATIVPRGRTLGVVVRAPESDVSSQTYASLKADLAVAMAGRVAEEIMFGKNNITTGAMGDFEQATRMARAMVMQYGMSSDLKPYFVENAAYGLSNVLSPEMHKRLEQEVEKLLDEAAQTARQTITTRWDDFLKLADGLLEKETLDADDLARILGPNAARGKVLPNRMPPAERAGPRAG